MRNKRLLLSFIWYCLTHRHERFWQAMRNWSKASSILKADLDSEGNIVNFQDTFYSETRY